MRIDVLSDSGTAKRPEDNFAANFPFFMVVDGFSAPYGPKNPLTSPTGAEIAKIAKQTFDLYSSKEYPSYSLWEVISFANDQIAKIQKRNDKSLNRADKLAGASFAAIKMNTQTIDVVQAGDSFALWVTKEEKVFMTKNQVFNHDTKMHERISSLMQKIAKEKNICLDEATAEERNEVRKEMWNRFYPYLSKKRLENINKKGADGYGCLNGQLSLEEIYMHGYVHSICRGDIKLVLLFTDGIVPWSVMESLSEQEIAERIYSCYQQGGLQKIRAEARKAENKTKKHDYQDHAELTIIAIEL